MNDSWSRLSAQLEKKLPAGTFQVWVRPLDGHVDDNHLCISAPNQFVASWVRSRLSDVISETARDCFGRDMTLSVQVSSNTLHCPAPVAVLQSAARPLVLPLGFEPPRMEPAHRWRHTFEQFVVGDGNQLAFAASREICERTLSADQLFLCAGPGLGKTHLVHAIGHALSLGTKPLRIGCLTGEEFGNQLVMSLKSRTIDTFKARFRDNLDVLLLEDIHFFQDKTKMQEELLSTIKALQAGGKMVVFTSSFLPRDLSRLDGQLLSYLGSSFLAVIHKPDHALRSRIIRNKAESMQIRIPDPVAELVASSLTSDIRQLESCIKSMAIKARLLREKITLRLAREVLKEYATAVRHDIDSITAYVCRSFEISEDRLKSKSRRQNVVVARNTAFYLVREHTDLPLETIGQHFNRRHSTVIKGISNIERELAHKSSVGKQIRLLTDNLKPSSSHI